MKAIVTSLIVTCAVLFGYWGQAKSVRYALDHPAEMRQKRIDDAKWAAQRERERSKPVVVYVYTVEQ